MKILITGARGMVGRNLCEASAASAHELLVPGRDQLDLTQAHAVDAFLRQHRPEFIIHAAGRVGGIVANMRAPVAFLEENLAIGLNLISAARRQRVPRLLNLASSCMYPRSVPNPLREEQILTGELEPTNEGYALAKCAALRLCQYIQAETTELAYKTVIPCNLYGRFNRFDAVQSHMIPGAMVRIHAAMAAGQRRIAIWGNGTARREFLYAGDLAAWIWRAVEVFDQLPPVLNLGLGRDLSIDDYYQALAHVMGFDGDFYHDDTQPAGMQRKLLDVSRMQALGFPPARSLREGLALTYEYFLRSLPRAVAASGRD